MKSLSLKNSSLRKAFNFSECFDTKATVGSILYSRCLLYIVLFVSLINLFYIINIKNTYSLVIFFLVGFITSFFVKNMIIIILFATFVSLFFQSTQYQTSENFFEGFEQDNKKDKKSGDDDEEEFIEETGESEGKNENEKQEKDSKKKDKMEGYKYSFQGEKPDISTNDDEEEDFSNIQPSKTSQLKKDMEQYFEIQKELLTVLEKAEPLQKKAEAFKERFNTKK
jgi:hypothetical protein